MVTLSHLRSLARMVYGPTAEVGEEVIDNEPTVHAPGRLWHTVSVCDDLDVVLMVGRGKLREARYAVKAALLALAEYRPAKSPQPPAPTAEQE